MKLDRNAILQSLANVLGDQVRRPRVMRLGNPLTGEVKVSLDDADTPGRVYVHGIGGENLSDVETDDENKQTVSQATIPPALISDDYLIYGTPVEVTRKNGLLHIQQLESIGANEYLYNVKLRPQRSIDISQIDYGLIRPTAPSSLRVLVTGARYVLNGVAYDVPTLQSASMAGYRPSTRGMAVAVKIEIDPTTAALYYEAGSEFQDTLSHAAAFGDYPTTISEDRFLCGWIKVKASQTNIQISDIYHAPELLNKTSSSDGILASIRLQEQGSDIATPDSGFRVVYAKSGGLYTRNSAGTILGPLTSVHNDLSGLTTGDPHTQYLLVSGTRPMSGDLQLGANEIIADEISTPATPASGKRKVYAKSDGWYDLDDMGVETPLGSGGGGGEVTHGAYVRYSDGYVLDSTYGYIPFTDALYDTDDYHDEVINNERLTIQSGMAGLYHLNAQIDISEEFENGGDGPVQIAIVIERSSTEYFLATSVFRHDSYLNPITSINLSVDYPLEVGDFARVKVTKGFGSPAYNGSGSAMSIDGWFSLRRLPALFEA